MIKSSHFNRGDRVLLCVNDARSIHIMHELKLPYEENKCTLRTPYLLKRVAGIPGDNIIVNSQGIFINNVLQHNSRPLDKYKTTKLNPLKPQIYKLKDKQYFMLGETPHSYDSRYFGIINYNQIKYKAILLCRK